MYRPMLFQKIMQREHITYVKQSAAYSSTVQLSWVEWVKGKMPRREVLPYMGYISMCHCEGYGFQAVYSKIGYIN